MDPTHSPEYNLVELYQADADYRSLRAVAHQLITTTARAALGDTTVRSPTGRSIDLAAGWNVIPFYEAVSSVVGRQITPETPAEHLHELARDHQVPTRATAGADEILLELYDHLVEPDTIAPTVYTDFPAGPSPLAQTCAHDPRLA